MVAKSPSPQCRSLCGRLTSSADQADVEGYTRPRSSFRPAAVFDAINHASAQFRLLALSVLRVRC